MNMPRTLNTNDKMEGSYLGPEFSELTIENELKRLNAKFIKHEEKNLLRQSQRS